MSNQHVLTTSDVTPDWREAWGSESDITTSEPQRAAPPPGIFAPTPDAIARALDEFLTEAPLAPALPAPLALTPPLAPPPPVASAAREAPVRRPLPARRLVAGATAAAVVVVVAYAAAVLLSAVVVVIRGQPVPAAGADVLVTQIPAEPPEAAAQPETQRAAAPSPQLASGSADTPASDRSALSSAQAPVPSPPAAPAVRRAALAARAVSPALLSTSDRPTGAAPIDRPESQSAVPALDVAAPALSVGLPGAPAELTPAADGAVLSSPQPQPLPASEPRTASPATSVTPAPTDRQAIQALLGRYQAALSRLDANAVRAVWPGVNAPALERAFGQVERQNVAFGVCSVAIIGAGATARCQGSASYVPRVGNRTERTDSRHWQIDLRKTSDSWQIVAVDSRE